jgi:hypothetical protein
MFERYTEKARRVNFLCPNRYPRVGESGFGDTGRSEITAATRLCGALPRLTSPMSDFPADERNRPTELTEFSWAGCS